MESSLSVFSSFLGFLEFSRAKWPQWARVSRFGSPGRGYGQKRLQNAHLEHFGCLAPDMGKSDSRRLISTILGAWPRIWAKGHPEGSFGALWELGRRYGQKGSQKPSGLGGLEFPRFSRVFSVFSSVFEFIRATQWLRGRFSRFSLVFSVFSSVFSDLSAGAVFSSAQWARRSFEVASTR